MKDFVDLMIEQCEAKEKVEGKRRIRISGKEGEMGEKREV